MDKHLKNKILSKAKEIEGELIKIRRDIHAHPEFGFQEIRTSALVAEKLNSLGLEVKTNVGETGVVGVLRGSREGKTVLLRGDMDCLKIEEKNEYEYKSQNPGFMHACGHDAHTAWLLGSAEILSELKEYFSGSIKFVFQPGEENGGGAAAMIRDGIMDDPHVDAVLGAHVWPSLETGKIGVKTGPIMAATDYFKLIIHGRGAHGAQPQQGIDPIALGNLIYSGFQNIVSRRIDPLEPAVLTVGKFISGTAYNIIPDSALLEGTVRTLNTKLRADIQTMMEDIVKGITKAYEATYELTYIPYHPVVENDIWVTDIFEESVTTLFGKEALTIVEKGNMAGEDFSSFQQIAPGTFFWVGTKNVEKKICNPLHSNNFDIDESILSRTSATFAFAAIELLKRLNQQSS